MERPENQEIEHVQKRVPRWFKNPNQINSQILISFLKLQEGKKKVSYEDLAKICSEIKTFKGNFTSMNNMQFHNHAKVFDIADNDEIVLWQPVEKFIKSEYQKYLEKTS